MSVLDRRSWDDGAADEAVANFNAAASRLESLISQRDQDVSRAMADYRADGASAQYQAKERRWHDAADQVEQIVATLRGSLQESGRIAASASRRAAQAAAGIG